MPTLNKNRVSNLVKRDHTVRRVQHDDLIPVNRQTAASANCSYTVPLVCLELGLIDEL